jgi:uncharacterized delta-60 repeat protein
MVFHAAHLSLLAQRARTTFAALALIASTATLAAPGDLDSTFGSGFGRVRTPVADAYAYIQSSGSGEVLRMPSIVLQPNGKIIVAAGCKTTGSTWDLCVVRYNANGSLDDSFGVAGLAVTDMRGTDDYIAGVVLQADGKIVVAGSCTETASSGTGEDFCLMRLNANGVLDTTFATAGKAFTSIRDFDDNATGVALQADGKIVVAGVCAASTANNSGVEACVVRYTAAGVLDTSFSGDGKLIVRPSGVVTPVNVYNRANSVAIAADGKIVIAGSSGYFPDTSLRIARILGNGTIDNTFSSDGVATVNPATGWLFAQAVTIQPDGQILVTGLRVTGQCGGPPQCIVVLRFTETGVLDTSFGVSGTASLDATDACFLYARSVALQSDGKIVLTGECRPDGNSAKFSYARLHGDGSIDQTFATNGFGSIGFDSGNFDYGTGVAMQPDGKIVQVGACFPSAFCVARYEGGPFGARNCTLDIDGDGSITATVDSLIHARIALGITGTAVLGGITFPANAVRDQWGTNTSRDIRKYLVSQCGMSIAP